MIIPDFWIIGVQDPNTQSSALVEERNLKGLRKNSKPGCLTENATKPQII